MLYKEITIINIGIITVVIDIIINITHNLFTQNKRMFTILSVSSVIGVLGGPISGWDSGSCSV